MFAARNMPLTRPATGSGGYDADAQTWFDGIVAAGSTISTSNKAAVSAFVAGCKTDGIWSAIKACCLLCAADGLAGALVPLVGAAPTNYGFGAGNYSRTLGLYDSTRSSSIYLDSNRNNNADPQNNRHMAAWINNYSYPPYQGIIGTMTIASGGSWIFVNGWSDTRMRAASTSSIGFNVTSGGFIGHTRSGSGGFTARHSGGAGGYVASASDTPYNENIMVFKATLGASGAQIPFYSIGENLDLALLESRVSTLMAALT